MSPPDQRPPVSSNSADESIDIEAVLEECLAQLAAGNEHARVRIIEVCQKQLHDRAHRLLRRKYAKVGRWNDTGDVAQNAGMRLYRALGDVVPDSPRGLMALMATHIHRELIDLVRKHSGPMSYAANHGTNVVDTPDGPVHAVDRAADNEADDDELPIQRWEEFHAVVERLPDEQRELFSLIWYLGLNHEAVAKTLGCGTRTVSRRWREIQDAIGLALNGLDEPA